MVYKGERMKKRPQGQYISIFRDGRYNKSNLQKRDDRSIWEIFQEFVNEKINVDGNFSRREMLEYVYPTLGMDVERYMNLSPDHYRSCLTKDHIMILKLVETGLYKKLQNIPKGLTTTRLIKIARDKTWKRWFIPFDDRWPEHDKI